MLLNLQILVGWNECSKVHYNNAGIFLAFFVLFAKSWLIIILTGFIILKESKEEKKCSDKEKGEVWNATGFS